MTAKLTASSDRKHKITMYRASLATTEKSSDIVMNTDKFLGQSNKLLD